MAKRARRDYRDPQGNKMPGVTTVIGENLAWGKEALMAWAHKKGLAGEDFRRSRDSAASAGTDCHAWVAEQLGGDSCDLDDYRREQAENNGARVVEAIRAEGWEIVHLELAVDGPGFGGTMDYVVRARNGSIGIADLKTGGAYGKDVVQLGAYATLWEAVRGPLPPATWGAIVDAKIGRDVRIIPVHQEILASGAGCFAALLAVHQARAAIEAAIERD